MEPPPLFLVTNDDGVTAPGLTAAAEAVASLGTPLVVAPAVDQTGMGRAYARVHGAGSIREHTISVGGHSTTAYSVVGSPAETVAHAILELAPRRPALCVAGINTGANVGLAIGVSGTIGAALEADSLGVPSIAVSIERDVSAPASPAYDGAEWTVARALVQRFAAAVLDEGLPPSTAVLNVNVPTGATAATTLRRTRQAQQNVWEPVAPDHRDRGAPHRLAIITRINRDALHPDDDVRAVFMDRVVSVTLLRRSLNDDAPWPLPGT